MKTNRFKDQHLSQLHHELTNINAINSWRDEAIKSAVNQEQKDVIDARVFELREASARGAR
jgi:hypothetical protein